MDRRDIIDLTADSEYCFDQSGLISAVGLSREVFVDKSKNVQLISFSLCYFVNNVNK